MNSDSLQVALPTMSDTESHRVSVCYSASETRDNRFEGKFGVNDRVQPIFVKLTDLTRASNLHSR